MAVNAAVGDVRSARMHLPQLSAKKVNPQGEDRKSEGE